MKASVKWLNAWLPGAPLSADQIEAVLTDAGFPIDARESVPGGDMRLEVEITSNRGDCLSHEGLAREIGAKLNREVKRPEVASVPAAPEQASAALQLDNRVHDVCPRFTARIIRGVRVGPSPAWLVERLQAVGQRSINNIVDITNYLTFEYGQPCHAFDLAKLAPAPGSSTPALVVRWAHDGEALTTLDGKKRTLKRDELVVADGQRAQSLAGVIGGGDSEVTPATRDIVLEAATWDPVTVRRAARRHQVRTDASHRFERIVDPRTIDAPALHAAVLIAQLGGGTLLSGVLDQGAQARPRREITLRLPRVEAILGVAAPAGPILERLGVEILRAENDAIVCRIPPWRPDLEREIDLIEEVGRIHGLDKIPIKPRVSIAVRGPQTSERAMGEVTRVLSGLGFFETVTFSFVSPKAAGPFLAPGLSLLSIDDARRKEEPTLRPSTIPSLLTCRRVNQDAGASPAGGVRLCEVAAVFAEQPVSDASRRATTDSVREARVLGLLLDVPGVGKGKPGSIDQRQHGLRLMRGAIEAVAHAVAGPGRLAIVAESGAGLAGYDARASARITLDGAPIGVMGLIDAAAQRAAGVDVPVVAAELQIAPLIAGFPPRRRIEPLPAFPGIERDVSVIVGEGVAWARIEQLVRGSRPVLLSGVSFVGVYRGKPIESGKKSVTLRLSFREPTRTLRDEEVTPQVEGVIALLARELGAGVRTA